MPETHTDRSAPAGAKTNALLSTLTKPLKPRKPYAEKRITGSSGRCAIKAACGKKCCCEAGIHHELHICRREDCQECHSRTRYDEAKKRQGAIHDPG